MKIRLNIFVSLLAITVIPAICQASTLQESVSTSAHFILLTEVRRLFTFDQLGKAQLTLAIDNGLLINAKEEIEAGNTDKANADLVAFENEQTTLQGIIDAQDTSSRSLHHLLGDIISDEATQLNALRDLGTKSSAAKILADKTPDAIAHNLALPVLTTDERELELAEATTSIAKSVSAEDKKIASKISLKNKIDDTTKSSIVKEALETEENAEVAEAAHLSTADLSTLVTDLNKNEAPRHNLSVLQKLLNQVPEPAKVGIETALDVQATAEAKKIENEPSEANELDDAHKPNQVRTAILDRVKSKIEKPEKKASLDGKIQEVEKETTTNQIEKTEQPSSGSGETSHGTPTKSPVASPTATPTPSTSSHSGSNDTHPTAPSTATPQATVTATPSPSSTTEVNQSSVSIRFREGKFDTSTYTVSNNSRVTVQFENDSSAAATLVLSNGLKSISVSNQGKSTLQSFIITGPVTFSTIVNGTTSTGVINVN